MRGTDFYSRSDKDLIIYYNRKATERDTTKISPTSSKKKKDPYLQKTILQRTTLATGVHGVRCLKPAER